MHKSQFEYLVACLIGAQEKVLAGCHGQVDLSVVLSGSLQQALPRWMSERPVDSHLLKNFFFTCCLTYCSFEQALQYSKFWVATIQILAKRLTCEQALCGLGPFLGVVFACIPLRWLPTVLTVSTPEEGWRTKNEVFVSTLGFSTWHSQWRLATHLGFLFGSYEYIADCFHGNKQSQR